MTRRRHQRDPGTSHTLSQRQLRVGELVRHALADMLTRGAVHDPVIQGHLITVPEVRMTADLRLATIYVVPLGGRDAQAVLDERFDEAERIEKLLRTPAVQRDLDHKTDDHN